MTKVAKKVKKALTLRQVLDVVDSALVKQDGEARKLWWVLTALRGPDDENKYSLKQSGTVPIRRAAFPKLVKASNNGQYNELADFDPHEFILPPSRGHVEEHIQYAAKALGLLDAK